jgi:hypothetical protein
MPEASRVLGHGLLEGRRLVGEPLTPGGHRARHPTSVSHAVVRRGGHSFPGTVRGQASHSVLRAEYSTLWNGQLRSSQVRTAS